MGKETKRVRNLIKSMNRERGYSSPSWAYAAEKDVNFIEAYDNLYRLGLKAGKVLPVKTRELIAIVLLAFRGSESGVYQHIRRALKYGATKQEVFEALETSIIPGGAPTFSTGIRALMKIEEEEKSM